MAALKEGDVIVCGCCDLTIIISRPRGEAFDMWSKETDGWHVSIGINPDLIDSWHYHPDPDRVHAEFVAAQLLGKIDEAR